MSDTVFYSWQSDLPNSSNRGFIQRAIEAAVESIRHDDSLLVDPVLDRDTAGVAGSPDIVGTIFEKIRSASALVADVSSIGPAVDGRRPTPNPNVLLELGYAVAILGWERVVLVVNTAFGRIEDLPFDLRQRRAIAYECSPDASDKAGIRRALSGKIEAALRAVLPAANDREADGRGGPPMAHPAVLISRPNEIGHIYYAWDVMVREANEDRAGEWYRAERHCTIRAFSPALQRASFEHADENEFLDRVRRSFPEDANAELGDPDPRGIRILHRDGQLRFDRTWTWGTVGSVSVVGIATTLPSLTTPGHYSLADVLDDVVRFFALVAELTRDAPVIVWLELAAPELEFTWAPSAIDRAGAERIRASESRPGTAEGSIVEKSFDAGSVLADEAAASAGEMLQIAVTRVHRARVDRARLSKIAAEALVRRAL